MFKFVMWYSLIVDQSFLELNPNFMNQIMALSSRKLLCWVLFYKSIWLWLTISSFKSLPALCLLINYNFDVGGVLFHVSQQMLDVL